MPDICDRAPARPVTYDNPEMESASAVYLRQSVCPGEWSPRNMGNDLADHEPRHNDGSQPDKEIEEIERTRALARVDRFEILLGTTRHRVQVSIPDSNMFKVNNWLTG
jgi:hypothetical protein